MHYTIQAASTGLTSGDDQRLQRDGRGAAAQLAISSQPPASLTAGQSVQTSRSRSRIPSATR